ncbi:MAG: hypothetical protein IPG11_12380 [Flavobacteriales bacterium]|nr:hypothetical protein [Flavobacteriales bacterium]
MYKYADITYVGGGFGPGIHNTLEAAAWGKPVIFGPNHQRFAEALGLIEVGAGFPVRNADEFGAVLHRLLHDQKWRWTLLRWLPSTTWHNAPVPLRR